MIKYIIIVINIIINILNKFYILSKNIITKFDIESSDYYTFKNIKEIIHYINIINEDINRIINEKDIFKKFNNIMDIYNKMNNILDNNNILNKKNR